MEQAALITPLSLALAVGGAFFLICGLLDFFIAETVGAGVIYKVLGFLRNLRNSDPEYASSGLDYGSTPKIFRCEMALLYWSILLLKMGIGLLLLVPLIRGVIAYGERLL